MNDDRRPEAYDENEPESVTGGEDELPSPESGNPSGISRGDCDTDEGQDDQSCDFEATAQVKDMFLGETLPGEGIAGYDAEEDGGG